MSKTVTESIFTRNGYVIPFAEVQHIEPRNADGCMAVLKSSTWNIEQGDYNNAIFMDKELADAFISAWCRYRAELEASTLMDLSLSSDDAAPRPAAPVELKEPGTRPAVFYDWPEFHASFMSCGLEDRGITDKYEAMLYGWNEAIDQVRSSLGG